MSEKGYAQSWLRRIPMTAVSLMAAWIQRYPMANRWFPALKWSAECRMKFASVSPGSSAISRWVTNARKVRIAAGLTKTRSRPARNSETPETPFRTMPPSNTLSRMLEGRYQLTRLVYVPVQRPPKAARPRPAHGALDGCDHVGEEEPGDHKADHDPIDHEPGELV